MHPHVSGTESVGFLKTSSLKQDAHGNLVVKTLIFVSGHETWSTAIPKLGITQISVSGHETWSNHWIFPFPPFVEGAQVHCTCTPMFLEQNTWASLMQDACGNLVVKTPIFVSGHEPRSTAIPKLGKTWISMSGHETRSNPWIFPFPPFAEGVCCERPLDVIIIPTNGHTTVPFFQVVIIFELVLVQIDLIHFKTYKMY